MREFLIAAAPYLVWFLAVTELGLEIFSVMKARKRLNVLSACVCFGLAVDALIQAFGVVIGEGAFLHGLSQVRYILHGVLVPLLIPIAFYTYGVERNVVKRAIWIVTGMVIAAGISMFVFSALGPATGNMDLNFLLTMIGEDIMVFFFGFELVRAGRSEETA